MRWRQRFGVLIEALLLRSAGNLEALGLRSAADLLARHRVIGRLTAIALRLQSAKRRKESLSKMATFLRREVAALNEQWRGQVLF